MYYTGRCPGAVNATRASAGLILTFYESSTTRVNYLVTIALMLIGINLKIKITHIMGSHKTKCLNFTIKIKSALKTVKIVLPHIFLCQFSYFI